MDKGFRSKGQEAGQNAAWIPWWGHLLVVLMLAAYLTSVAEREVELYFVCLLGIVGLVISLLRLDWGLAVVPLVLLNPVKLTFTGTNLLISEYFLLIVFSVWFLAFLSFQEEILFPRRFLIPILILLASSAVSVAAATYTGVAILQFVRYIEVFAVLFVVVLMTVRSSEAIYLVISGIMVGGLIAAFIGMFQFVTGEGARADTRRVFGFLGGGYGCGMATTLYLAFSVLIHPSPKKVKILGGFAVPILAVGLVMSQTRTWMGAFLVAVLVSLLFARKEVRRVLLITLPVVVAGVVVVIATNAFGLADRLILQGAVRSAFRWQTMQGSGAVEELSLLMRLNAWAHAFGLFLQHPLFGIGLGNLRVSDYFSFKLAAPSTDAGYIDNQTVQFFVEAGFIAGCAWLVYLGNAFVVGWRAVRASGHSSLSGAVHGLFGCLVIFFLGSNFWVITPSHELFSLFVMVIALLVSSLTILNRQHSAGLDGPPAGRSA